MTALQSVLAYEPTGAWTPRAQSIASLCCLQVPETQQLWCLVAVCPGGALIGNLFGWLCWVEYWKITDLSVFLLGLTSTLELKVKTLKNILEIENDWKAKFALQTVWSDWHGQFCKQNIKVETSILLISALEGTEGNNSCWKNSGHPGICHQFTGKQLQAQNCQHWVHD